MASSKLSHAICTQNLKELSQLLESESCSPDGDGYGRFHPVVECILSETESESNCRNNTRGATKYYSLSVSEEDTQRCEVLKVLVRHGADINARLISDHSNLALHGETAAILAARRGYFKCLQLLVESGADLTMKSRSQTTALIASVEAEQTECVRYLVEHSPASVVNHRGPHGMTALMCAAFFSGEKRRVCMQHLHAAGADVNTRDDDGKTALVLAVRNRNTAAITLLLQNEAQVNSLTDDGETPLSLALEIAAHSFASYKPVYILDIVNKLYSHGADPTSSRRFSDFLHRAVMYADNALIQTAVRIGFPPLDCCMTGFATFSFRRGFDDNKMDFYLKTNRISPLTIALLYNKPDTARYFIANQFFTKFDLTMLGRHSELRGLLRDLGVISSLAILDFLSARPRSLFSLSLVAVSTALTQRLVCHHGDHSGNQTTSKPDGEPNTLKDGSSSSESDRHNSVDKWTFQPTFRERVECLGLPPPLQRTLLHQTTVSKCCVRSWNEIALTRDGSVRLPVCKCAYCESDE